MLRVLVLGRSLSVKGFGLGFPNVQGFGLSSNSYLYIPDSTGFGLGSIFLRFAF